MKLHDNIGSIMFAPCGMNCKVCYRHLKPKKSCKGCLCSDEDKPEHCRKCSGIISLHDAECSECHLKTRSSTSAAAGSHHEKEARFMIEHLDGGRDNIIKNNDIVYRPSHEWTSNIHDFLRYLHKCGFVKVPFPHGINEDGQELVSFVDGEVFNNELSQDARSDDTLISFAKFIRKFHDLGADYIECLNGNEKWMLPVQTEIETMCHGDLAPYNTALEGKRVVGLIDFDTLHPGSRIWDVSYALYRWIPLMSEDNPENFGTRSDKSRRIELFFDAYGTDVIDREGFFDWVIRRLEYLVSYIKQEANNGDESFEQHINDGHIKSYLEDVKYISEQWQDKA